MIKQLISELPIPILCTCGNALKLETYVYTYDISYPATVYTGNQPPPDSLFCACGWSAIIDELVITSIDKHFPIWKLVRWHNWEGEYKYEYGGSNG